MKKSFLAMTVFLFLLSFAACSAATTMTPAAPTDLAIADNVLTFDAVSGATAYQLSVEDAEGDVTVYGVDSGTDLTSILDYGLYTVRIRALFDSGEVLSAYGDPVDVVLVDPDAPALLEEEAMNDLRYVSWIGRTRYDDLDKTHYMYYTASGFEVGFYGTELTAVFTAQNVADLAKRPYLVILVDGEENPYVGRHVQISAATQTVTLVHGLPEGYHTVKVLKRSEALDGDLGLRSLATDGRFAAPDERKDLRILYVGDSSMTGYGNLASSPGTGKTTSNSDGLLDFAYLSAYIHDAAFTIVASSGWGVSRGWNTPGGAIDEIENMPSAFDHFAIDGTNKVRTDWGQYDTSTFVPDVVVITLGTNDFNAPGYDSMSEADQAALRERFVADYVAFLVHLDEVYPNVPIIVGYGIMADADRIGDSCTAVIAQANALLGDRVHGLLMPAAGTSHPFGSDYHPQAATHIEAADALADLIATVTGHARVRDNVSF